MRNISDMAMLVSDSDRPSPKVWQPWYIDESDGVRKALPTRAMREQRARDRMTLQKPYRRTLSPSPSSDEEIDVGGGHPHPAHVGAYSYAYIEDAFDDDAPLDMSIKRRTPPHAHTPTPPIPPPAHTPTHSHTPPPLQPPPAHTPTASSSPPPYSSRMVRGRPTVITCAPWYLPPTASALPPPPPYDVAAAHLREHRRAPLRLEGNHTPPTTPTVTPEGGRSSPECGNDAEASRRHVVEAGPVDPEIDEHFRRSLGRNYQELFVSEPPPDQQHESNDSVDDHFAKALGATWTKLKAEGEKGSVAPLSISRISPPPSGTPSPTVTPLALPRGSSVMASVVSNHSRSFSPTHHPLRTAVVASSYVVTASTTSTASTSSTKRIDSETSTSKFIATKSSLS